MAASIHYSSNPLVPVHQSEFFTRLPREIMCAIFSYLDQQDYLTGMETCKAWYKLFPGHARHAWSSVQVLPRDIHMRNRRFELCLGSHVKTVTFKGFKVEAVLYNMVKKLFDKGCTRIKILELIDCTSRNQTMFLKALQRLALSLVHLKMIQHNGNVAFLRVFDICTKLTHFTYKPTLDAYTDCEVYNQEPSVHEPCTLERSEYPSVVYLCLDTIIDKRLRLDPILRRCPNLRYFIGASSETYGKIISSNHMMTPLYSAAVAVDLDTLLSWCPKISLIENNWSHWAHNELRESTVYQEGLRYLAICETDDYSRDQIAVHLTNHQDTLEYFALTQYTEDDGTGWSRILCEVRLPQLQTLILDSICATVNSISSLLNHCPMLETLYLHEVVITVDPSVVQASRILSRVRTLMVDGLEIIDVDLVAAILGCYPILESLTIRNLPFVRGPFRVDHLLSSIIPILKNLTYLEIIYVRSNDGDGGASDDESEARCLFHHESARESKAETIILRGMSTISYRLLQVITSIGSLRTLDVDLDEAFCKNDQHNLYLFAQMLAKTVIEELKLFFIHHVPNNVLGAFAQLPRLTLLALAGPRQIADCTYGPAHIDGFGLLQVLSRSTSLTNITIRQMKMSGIDHVMIYNVEIKALKELNSNWTIHCGNQLCVPAHEKDDFWQNEQALHYVEFRRNDIKKV